MKEIKTGRPAENENDEPNIKSEFSMGLFDFKRFSELLHAMDEFRFRIRLKPTVYAMPFFSALDAFYVNIRPVLNKKQQEGCDKEISSIESELMSKKGRISYNLICQMTKFHRELLNYKQIAGLGLAIQSVKSSSKRAKVIMGDN